MKKEQSELATDLVGLIETHLGDHYREVSTQLNESLYASDTSPADAIANAETLKKVVQQFPARVDGTGWSRVTADDPAQVRWLQSSLIWEKTSYHTPARPAYLIGVQAVKGQVNFLLHDVAAVQEPQLYVARGISARQYARADEFMRTRRTMPLSETELNMARRGSMYQFSLGSMPVVAMTNGERHSLKRSNYKGVTLRVRGAYEPLASISDERLASFNVIDHVGHLAVGFNVAAEVNEIFAARS